MSMIHLLAGALLQEMIILQEPALPTQVLTKTEFRCPHETIGVVLQWDRTDVRQRLTAIEINSVPIDNSEIRRLGRVLGPREVLIASVSRCEDKLKRPYPTVILDCGTRFLAGGLSRYVSFKIKDGLLEID